MDIKKAVEAYNAKHRDRLVPFSKGPLWEEAQRAEFLDTALSDDEKAWLKEQHFAAAIVGVSSVVGNRRSFGVISLQIGLAEDHPLMNEWVPNRILNFDCGIYFKRRMHPAMVPGAYYWELHFNPKEVLTQLPKKELLDLLYSVADPYRKLARVNEIKTALEQNGEATITKMDLKLLNEYVSTKPVFGFFLPTVHRRSFLNRKVRKEISSKYNIFKEGAAHEQNSSSID